MSYAPTKRTETAKEGEEDCIVGRGQICSGTGGDPLAMRDFSAAGEDSIGLPFY